MTKTLPSVSIVVPCRNERHHIEACVQSILAQNPPPGGLEIIVVDGMSDDGTREVLQRMARADERLKVVDNPQRITPCARNLGIRAARGSYIAILDAHTEYSPNYILTCFELLNSHPEVCCVGGPIISQGKGVFGRSAAEAMSHPLGIGNAKHRLPNYEGYAEGACFPMFRKDIFDKVGLFDEDLVRNQDDEFNFRLAQSGEKVFISPSARCIYYVRETPSLLFRQYFQYGYWRVAVLRKHGSPASVRQLAPVSFFFVMLLFLVLGLFLQGFSRTVSVFLPTVYVLMLLTAGALVALNRGVLVGLMFPIAAMILHLGYAAGFAWGIVGAKGQTLTNAISR